MGLGGAERISLAFARNFSRHPAQQKKYSFLPCSVLKRAVAGSTSIPHTGSFAVARERRAPSPVPAEAGMPNAAKPEPTPFGPPPRNFSRSASNSAGHPPLQK